MDAESKRVRVPTYVPSPRKPYNDCAGYVCSLRSGAGRGWVVVYRAASQGIDVAGMPWATVCETHSTLIGAPSERAAREHMKAPAGWCEDCRAALAGG